MKYKAKKKSTLRVIKYTGDNERFLIENAGALVEEPYVKNENVSRLWVKNYDGGDVLYPGQYLVQDTDYDAYSIEADRLESKYSYTGKDDGIFQIWEQKDDDIVEAIRWDGDNTKDVEYFLNHKGALDQSGTCFIIMNFSGGSVAHKGDYIINSRWEYWTMPSKYFEDAFEEYNDLDSKDYD